MPSPQRGGRIADDYLDATVLLPAGGGIIVCHGVAAWDVTFMSILYW
jgi:hypothetical protein